HGTFYGVMGQRSPSAAELKDLQDACAGDMNMMRHCRQCRADAVGLLGEDRGAEFSMEKVAAMDIDYAAALERRRALREKLTAEMEAKRARAHAPAAAAPQVVALHRAPKPALGRPVLMAVASKGLGLVNEHFGHAREFLIYEATAEGAKLVATRKTDLYCSGDDSCGDGESVLARTIRVLAGCEAVLCARIGFEPWGKLEAAGIKPNGEHALEPIADAVMAVWREMLAAGRLAAPTAAKKRA
ncbi:MAG: nitrogenase cofactor biosynthesis protein NifB, partial [Rhodocyclales bacterium]|nr:nitrogenase cofactor biosynthesis protein NifB [Rhodocyclales bacterium]